MNEKLMVLDEYDTVILDWYASGRACFWCRCCCYFGEPLEDQTYGQETEEMGEG